ncbi:MAG: 4-alpha-glucanotransferase [Thermodesulfobacteriota bacterium]
MEGQRHSGILLHVTSLPGPYGIGDIGSGLEFVDFLAAAGQRCWQFLPTCPTAAAFGHSPYMGLSALAGNILFISPDLLVDHGWLAQEDIEPLPHVATPFTVDFQAVTAYKEQLLLLAHGRLTEEKRQVFAEFCAGQPWLDDYALFMVARNHYQGAWSDWPAELAARKPTALAELAGRFPRQLELVKFGQFLFYEQWALLLKTARQRGVRLCGDIPIYVGHDSSDVWANQDCFLLDDDFLPSVVAGVPPDYFSATGQRWGNPLYSWETQGEKNKRLYDWWRQRFAIIGQQVDMVRIDHFRGFEAYWQVPAEEETALNGTWVKGPGRQFFSDLAEELADVAVIAEDLGIITPEVTALRDALGYPGMKILQFAFDSDERNLYLPFNVTENSVIYPGTHDNDTALGWYMDGGVAQRSKDRLRRLANSDGSAVHLDFIRLAYGSVANLAIIPLQDVLGYGSDCRMNRPGTSHDNWLWRAGEVFSSDLANFLREEARFYNRL